MDGRVRDGKGQTLSIRERVVSDRLSQLTVLEGIGEESGDDTGRVGPTLSTGLSGPHPRGELRVDSLCHSQYSRTDDTSTNSSPSDPIPITLYHVTN